MAVKRKKKTPMTLDRLAGMMQNEFTTVRDEFANVRTEMKDGFTTVRTEMRQDLTNVKLELEEHIRDLGHDLTKIERKLDGVPSIAEFDELRKRLERVEKKMGII